MGIKSMEEAQAYANKSGFGLSEKASRVVTALIRTGGKCPCMFQNAPECPCPAHKLDIERAGHCHCNLFVKKGDT